MTLPSPESAFDGLPAGQPPVSRRSALLGLAVVVTTALLLCLPFIRAVYWLGDEGILLRGGAILAAGGRIYTDFFAFYPPAGYMIMAGWIKIFGPSFLGVRLFAILIIAGIAGFSYLACMVVSDNVILSVFLAVAWLGTAQTKWIVGINHHWLMTMFAMAACWLTLRSLHGVRGGIRSALPGLAGLTAGTAAMVTSSCGLWVTLAAGASFLGAPRCRRALAMCLLGCLAVPLLCLAYIMAHGEFAAAYDGIVRFTLTQYASIQIVPFGNGLFWYYPNRYLFPLAGALALAMVARNPGGAVAAPQFRSCVLYALAGLLGLYPRPDIVHMAFTAPLALPLLAYGIARLTAHWRPGWRRVLFALGVIWCLPPAIGFVHQGIKALSLPTIITAAGPVALHGDEQYGGAQAFSLLASLPAGDQLFFYPYMPLMPYLAGRTQVSRFDIFVPGYMPAAQYFEACEAVTRQAQWVILDRSRMGARSWLTAFPAMRAPNPPETQAFERALTQDFVLVHRFGNFEIRQRTANTIATVPDADCGAILH